MVSANESRARTSHESSVENYFAVDFSVRFRTSDTVEARNDLVEDVVTDVKVSDNGPRKSMRKMKAKIPGFGAIAMTLVTLLMAGSFVTAAAQDDVDIRDLRRGKWRPQDIPDGFTVTKAGRYRLQSNCDTKTMKVVGRHMQQMFRVYSKHFPPKKTPTDKLTIKIFKNRKEFLRYGAPPSAAGYYSPREKEMVGYHTGKVGGEMTRSQTGDGMPKWREAMTMDLIGVFSHEGWHQFFHWSCGSQIPFPAWCDEGIGDYYYTAWIDGKKVVLGAINEPRLAMIQSAIRRDRHVPLGELVRYEQRDYYANAALCYAEGWSLVHFFFHHPDYKKKKYVRRFVKVFSDQHSIAKTNKQVFGKKFKWDKVEDDWKKWVLALPTVDVESLRGRAELDPGTERLIKAAGRAQRAYEKLPPHVQQAIDDVVGRRRKKPDDMPVKTPKRK